MSSARFGLIPKSAGGRMALGGMAALGVAGAVKSYRNVSTARKMDKMNGGRGPYPNGYDSPPVYQ
jgi:hypothetical protein